LFDDYPDKNKSFDDESKMPAQLPLGPIIPFTPPRQSDQDRPRPPSTPPGQSGPGQFPPGQNRPPFTPPGQNRPPFTPPGQSGPGQFPPGQNRPPFTPPGQFPPRPVRPPFTPPGQTPGRAPTSPPPSFVPSEQRAITFALDPGAVFPCRFRFSYIWPRRGQSFWAWIVFIGRRSLAGYRWTGRNWVYFAMDLRDIRNIQCF
jgi:hypothetical protein